MGATTMRSGEHEDDVVLCIIENKNDTICWYRCGCGTRKKYEIELEEWWWGSISCLDHQQMNNKSPELWEAYFDGLTKFHMIRIGN